jgi:hypothetical protein
MNKGITLAKGDWLYFLGSGDMLYNNDVLKSVFDNQLTENNDLIAGKVIYEGTTKPFIHSKSKMIKNVSWSALMWIRNGLHHQGTFYEKSLFNSVNYSLKYKILSDYWFNLWLYKNNKKCKIVDVIVAKCNSDGISKSGKWSVYQEEIALKTALTSKVLLPFFYCIAVKKFIFRKIINVG